MKIKDIRLKPLFSKFKKPYVWAMGKNLGQITILVEIETEEGINFNNSCLVLFVTMQPDIARSYLE